VIPATGFVPELVEFMMVFPAVVLTTERTHQLGLSGDCSGCSGAMRRVRHPCVHALSAREARRRLNWTKAENPMQR
jgi:hypothetical protein